MAEGVKQMIIGAQHLNPTLTVIDNRTSRSFEIPIINNAVRALEFRRISTLGVTASAAQQYNAGLRIFDPGFRNTAVVESEITHIDGLKGTIHYRGYSLDYLIENHDFEDVSHLVLFGGFPSWEEKLQYRSNLAAACSPTQAIFDAIACFPRDAPAYLMITAGLSAWAASEARTIPAYAGQELYLGKMEAADKGIFRAIAAASTVIALVSCHQRGIPFTSLDPKASLVENFLIMTGKVDATTKKADPLLVDSLNKVWIIYLDHEMNCSTATGLMAGSTLVDPISVCIACIVAGSGPLHAGAIDMAYKAFERIGSTDNVAGVIADVKAKKYRLFGYGHRIYKTVDPRVKHLKKILSQFTSGRVESQMLQVVLEIEKVASTDKYFTSRNLHVNADLYGCFVLTAMGFENGITIAMMALARSKLEELERKEKEEQKSRDIQQRMVWEAEVRFGSERHRHTKAEKQRAGCSDMERHNKKVGQVAVANAVLK